MCQEEDEEEEEEGGPRWEGSAAWREATSTLGVKPIKRSTNVPSSNELGGKKVNQVRTFKYKLLI